MATPSRGEVFAKLLHHLREAQDQSANMAHLHRTESGPHEQAAANGWLAVSELLKKIVYQVTELARRGFQ